MTEKQTQEDGYEVLRRRLAEGAAGFHLPRYRELPDVGLYLEQVVRLVNQLTAGRPGPLTASMVSNYVKQKLLPGPIRKIYGRESLAYLVFLAYMKTVVPLEDIRRMEAIQKSSYDLIRAYDYFCEEFENLHQVVYGIKTEPAVVGVDVSPEKGLLRSAILAVLQKMYLADYLALMNDEPAPPKA